MLSLLFLSSSVHSQMQLFFREGFNCLDSGFPGTSGHMGDFLSSSLWKIELFVFQSCFLFMPSHREKKKFPGAPGLQILQVQAHLYSLARLVFVYNDLQPFSIVSERNACVVEALGFCPCYGSCELLA